MIVLPKVPIVRLLAILAIGILLWTYLFLPDQQQSLRIQDDPFTQENKRLIEDNQALDASLTYYQQKTDSLSHLITSKNQIIHSLKSQIDEKINRINTLSTDELQQFFTRVKTDSIPH